MKDENAIEKCTIEKYICDDCDIVFYKSEKFVSHYQKYHDSKEEEITYDCANCFKSFQQHSLFVTHLKEISQKDGDKMEVYDQENHYDCTTSCQLTQTQILFSVKSISFWSYLKVYRGFTEKKPKEKFFLALPKKISDLQNFSHKSKTFTKLVIAQILLILHAFRKILHRLLCSAVI